ncbi:cellulose synthase complex periplasmic endoglucanase BcsZ [Sphaerotilus sulfidivorans]|uniref:cellulose synthase complex periplasmic endoglucanase BcsZ n=1 Tax=Sphaerotilus sp. FB-3 TaxID=2913396 RepID=UPI0020425A41|nr:cellulose synthase complex periplasmic endoglucanase BcsZ [Sphaerotilus sp. FB-3]GKQ58674.1 hypothetical protein QMTAC487_25340 [Sphaerotilus sp. FB-3]
MRYDAARARRSEPAAPAPPPAVDAARRQLLGAGLGSLGLGLGALAGCIESGAGAAPSAARSPATATAPLTPVADPPSAPASPPGTCLDFDHLWRRFVAQCVQPDGRVVDHDTPERVSTSESQTYTLFFALVADDRARFDKVLDWTRHNLAGGDFSARLPAWQWGLRDGRWGVLDANAASDADLWLAQALFEAARLWKQPAHAETARAILRRVQREEVVDVPGLGLMLLPGPQGFVSTDRQQWRFNPSYSAVHQLRALATHDPQGPWAELAQQGVKMIQAVSLNGLAPDWVTWQLERSRMSLPGGVSGRWLTHDAEKGDIGGYDAIRCYLWAAVLPPGDPVRATLLRALGGLQPWLQGDGPPPGKLSTTRATLIEAGPPGFDAVALPYLAALGDRAALARRLTRLQAAMSQPLRYYDLVLMLFAIGALQGRWQSGADGLLIRRAPVRYPTAPLDPTCRPLPTSA